MTHKNKKIHKREIVFLIRSFNEAKRITKVIDSIIDAWFVNILVVDDGSTDHTAKKLDKYSTLFYLKHSFNRWWWAALETWFEYLRRNANNYGFDYVVTFDADGQHNIKDLSKFVDAFEKNDDLDIVFWSRFIKKTNSNVPFFRRLILKWWIIFTYLLSWIKLSDSHNGYRMIKVSSLKKIHLTMSWMEYASELIEQIRKNKLKFSEVPVDIIYDDYTMWKGQRSSNAVKIAAKMVFNKFFG